MWFVGADIGQVSDPAALAAIEADGEALALRHLERLPLGTPYPAVVERIGAVVDALPGAAELVVDATGVGRPVVDALRATGRPLTAVSITSGRKVRQGEDGIWRVPKALLVRSLVAAVEGGRLRMARALPLLPAFERELTAFRARISQCGHAAFEGVGEHDDLVIAAALAMWWAATSHGRVCKENSASRQ